PVAGCTNSSTSKLYLSASGELTCGTDAGGSGTGDNILVNGTNLNNANFLDVTATATAAGISYSVNAVNPDEVSLAISAASNTAAGIVTANAQTFGGAKTFSGQIVANGGIRAQNGSSGAPAYSFANA